MALNWDSPAVTWGSDTVTWAGDLVTPVNDITDGITDTSVLSTDAALTLLFSPGDRHNYDIIPMRYVVFDVEPYMIIEGRPKAQSGLVVSAGPVCSADSVTVGSRPSAAAAVLGSDYRWLPSAASFETGDWYTTAAF